MPKTLSLPVYLDNNATTPVDEKVLEEMLPTFSKHFGNPASKTHSFGWFSEELVKIARERVASLINADPNEIIFTSGATEANNLAIKGVVLIKPAQEARVVSVLTEHRSVLDPLEYLRGLGAEVILLSVNKDGALNEEQFINSLTPKTVIVSIMLANNEIGVIHDISKLVSEAKKKVKHVIFHCDATQALGKIEVDVKKLGVDLLSVSAHKVYGPKGVGALYVNQRTVGSSLIPLFHGGGHEHNFRSGTLNVSAIVGFGKACEIVKGRLSEDAEKLKRQCALLLKGLEEKLDNVVVNGPLKNRLPGNLHLSFRGIESGHLIANINGKLAVSATSACTSQMGKASHVIAALGLEDDIKKSGIRIGVGRFTTDEEIEFAAGVLVEAVKKLCRVK